MILVDSQSSPTLRVLAQSPFFAGLLTPQLERIADRCRTQQFVHEACIYRSGDPARFFYAIATGTVRLAVGYGSRNASAGDLLRRHDVFGWAALTPNCGLRIATATCVGACTVLAIEGAELLALMEADHTLGYRLMTRLNALISSTMTAFAGG